MPQSFWRDILTAAQKAAAPVAERQRQDFRQVQAQTKTDGSLVTETDEWSDRQLRTALQAAFPDHGLLSEETSQIFPAHDWCWVIDPLDGTTNFARGIPLWGISLGLLYRGIPRFGYVEIPPLRQAFYGYWPGPDPSQLPPLPLPPCPQGAHWIGDTSQPSLQETIQTSPAELSPSQCFSFCTRSIHQLSQADQPQRPFPCKIRMLGVATYNLLTVALGSSLGGVEATPKVWDIAATWPIVQAAGGHWQGLSPGPIFPLQVGQDYQAIDCPSLVVAQPRHIEAFLPFFKRLGTKGLRG
ncbi:MAG: inositol monophosphatase [Synechococcales cyanobacterium RM1_1_8]|nr:inositol monophosphatase [Synechococcales cyanobacterium RM1_1_8]